ncbi:MAG: PAS-domain containing protein, partial [Pseudomonadota bacterium]
MPETELSLSAGVRLGTYGEQHSKWPRRIAARLTGLSFLATTFLADAAFAQSANGEASSPSISTGPFANSFEVMNFALVIGAVSAAMISAIWLIRERGKISQDNTQLRGALADASTELARYKALIVERDRAYAIWDGQSAAQFLGSLPPNVGAPRASRDLLAFGRWLQPASATAIERAIDSLRTHANSFDMEIETQRGHLLEAQGRISGGRAFVRLAALANVRAELASLKAEKDRLYGTVETQRTLLDAIEMPAWLRDSNGKLSWVNQAYAHAVEASDGNEAVEKNLEVLGTQVRERVRAERMLERPFFDRISTVVRGNRTFFEVTDAVSAHGSGGIAQDVTEAEAIREELKRTVNSHSETLDHLATPVAIFDGEQKLQFYNQAFQALWELDTPFLEAKPTNGELLERLRAEGRLPEPGAWRDWKEEVLSVYQSVDPQPALWHLPDGQTLNVFANVHPRGGVTWVFENLTEKYDLETRLNTLLKVQGETIDHLAEGVCVFGADGKLRLSNPAFRALWAIPEKDAQAGVHINEISDICKPSYDGKDGWAHFSSVITGYDEERQTHEGRLELYSGLVLDYAIVPLPNAQMMLTFVNVTDSAKVERALTDKNEALRKADALKNDFVQHVSYELRSPLTNIIGFTDLLKTPQ